MTRNEAEEAILERLREIRAIAGEYTPGQPDLLLSVHGDCLSLWNYAAPGQTEGVLDAWTREK